MIRPQTQMRRQIHNALSSIPQRNFSWLTPNARDVVSVPGAAADAKVSALFVGRDKSSYSRGTTMGILFKLNIWKNFELYLNG